MKENVHIMRAYGVLFLVLGLVWLSVILVRGERPFFRKSTLSVRALQKIQQELTVKLKGHLVSRRIPKQYVYHFWALAGWEFICALCYLVAGVSLLRRYPFRRGLSAAALVSDAVLKFLIVSYHVSVLQPLKKICQTADILRMYLTPDAGAASTVSSYVTGIRLVRPGALIYGAVYIAFLALSTVCLVRRPSPNK